MFPLLMGAGILLGAYSSYRQGQAQSDEYGMMRQKALYDASLADFDAKMAELDAAAAMRRTDFEQMRGLREGEAIKGSQLVGMGASGGRVDVSTNFQLRMQQDEENELDNFLIGLEGRTEATRFKTEAAVSKGKATMLRSQAGYYRKAGSNAKKAGLLGAAAGVLGGFGTMGAMGMFGGGGVTNTGGASSWGAGNRAAAGRVGP